MLSLLHESRSMSIVYFLRKMSDRYTSCRQSIAKREEVNHSLSVSASCPVTGDKNW